MTGGPAARHGVVVVGGGAAGVAAAAACGAVGRPVTVVERWGTVGGTAVSANVGTVCGLYHNDGTATLLPGETARRFHARLLSVTRATPAAWGERLGFLPCTATQFEIACLDTLASAGARVLLRSAVTGVARGPDGRIEELCVTTDDGPVTLTATAVVDCTGEAVVARAAGEDMLAVSEYQACAFVFGVGGLGDLNERTLAVSLLVHLRRGVERGVLPHGADKVLVVPGSVRDGAAAIKLAVPRSAAGGPGEGAVRLLARDVVAYLGEHLPGLRLSWLSPGLGVRTGPRPAGRQVLTEDDVVAGRKHPFPAAAGAWPVERWGDAPRPELRHLAPGDHYSIPVGCLRARRTKNLFYAGRCISADEGALASARVIGTCLRTGAAAGHAALLASDDPDVSDDEIGRRVSVAERSAAPRNATSDVSWTRNCSA